ncbi:S-methyl-5-thioribose kinase [Geosporobacter ferrireducens]|uniref:Methylthioribose kinase n=1 Tax=Geosporobacter ferrireducens TaxID=1424294 RepID=A0A1D8GP37_9FIRM|nr:S-methyl-5-thioribose kinase [Geosporobacter ferrireducens]AOT72564.1 S-methyl-5-thioribose kinase [Geosporobacter ferrireducens]
MQYYMLDEQKAMDYVTETGLFSKKNNLSCREIGDGNLNLVFIIKDDVTEKSMVLKQALPYVRVVGESWPLSVNRTRIEANALEVQNKLVPGLVPKLYHRNDDMALIIMEDLSHLSLMRYGMVQMKKFPKFSDHISTFLANMLFYTSDLYVDSEAKKHLVQKFVNPELCKITEDLIFTDPYYDAERNNINPALRIYLEETFWKKEALWLEVSKLKYKFLTEAQSLLHGDLHTGSIFANANETRVFDTEFAFVGPSAFDVGKIIGNLLINYISWSGKDMNPTDIKDYRVYLLDTVNDLYQQFEQKFKNNWDRDLRDISAKVTGYQEFYMRNIFVDAVGYAGAVMIRRMHGLAHNIDVDGIEDLEKRKSVQILILELAETLIINRANFNTIEDITMLVRNRIY